MKSSSRKLFHILFILASLTSFASADFEDVVTNIYSVSTDATAIGSTYRSLSSQGGAYLYIKGDGFSTDSATANVVTVGGVICPVISFLTTSTQVVCEAPAMIADQSYQVKVEVDGLRIATCGSCWLYYSYYNTPQLRYLIPNAGNPGDEIYFRGVQYVDDSTDVDYIKIGEFRCDATDQNEFDYVTFSNSYSDQAPCSVSTELEAGKYNVTQRNLGNTGYAQIMDTIPTFSFNSEAYDFLVVPAISSISNNVGSAEGQIITITGTGFSSTQGNTVSLGDTECKITSQSTTEIQCEVQPRSNAVPSQGFHTGLRYELYPGKTVANIKAGNAGAPNVTGSKLTAEIPQDLGTYFTAKLSGYFKAPTTGNYKFYLSADDTASLYISTTPLDKTALSLAVATTAYSSYKFYFTKNLNQVSDDIALTAGEFYYVEMYHTQNSGSEFATFGVKIPNAGNTVGYLPEVRALTINSETVYEVLEFALSNVDGGTWQISLGYLSSNKKYIEKTLYTDSMSYKVSASTVASKISSAFSLSTSVERTLYAANGTIIDDEAEAASFVFTVTLNQLRKNGVLPGIKSSLTGTGVSAKVTQTTAPSPAVAGSLNVAYGAKTVTIASDASTWTIQAAMRTLGFQDPISAIQIGNADFGSNWIIEFTGDAGATLGEFTITNTLTGGKTGSTITVTSTTLQQSSTDLFYPSIPAELLYTADEVSQITVTSNGILANCPSLNCDYALQTTDLPEIASASFTAPTLTLTIGSVATGDYKASDIRVFFGNTECTVSSYTDSSIPATLVASCSGPEAGTFTPRVHFNGLGYAAVATGVPAIVVPLVISNIIPTEVNPNGGTVFTVTGTGFPVSAALATTRGMTIKIGSANCVASAVSATSITCTNDAVSSTATLDIAINGQSGSTASSLTLLANPPTITSISPSTVNPVLQTDITITGTNFDSDSTHTTVYLGTSENSKVTDCLVISSTSTQIKCKLLGASTNTYNFYVQTSLGYSDSKTLLVQSAITGISPSTGSTAGGTLLTISGGTFSDLTTQTLVFIGDDNIACNVVSSSANQVTCTTQALGSGSTYAETAQVVYVDTRIVEEAICSDSANNCQFTYSDAATPKVTAVSATTAYPGDSLTLTGSGFTSTAPTVTIGNVACTVSTSSDTSITFTLPSNLTPSSAVNITVNVAGKGNAAFSGTNTISVPPKLASVSPLSGSSAGFLITLTGTGFVDGTTVKVGSTVCSIRSLTATSIVCKATSTGAVKISYGDFSSQACVSGSCSLTSSNSLTPTVSSVSPLSPTSAASFTLTVAGTQLADTPSVTLFSTSDSSISFVGTVSTSSATQIVATFSGVAAGTYNVEVASGSNLASYASTVLVPLSATIPSAVQTSLAGGSTLTISGSGFFDNSQKNLNKVDICGFECSVISSTSSSIECALPAFINPAVLDAYPLVASSETLTAAATWSDAGSESNVFDMTFTTAYTSTLNDCQIGWDAGENLLASISEISYFPNPAITSNTLAGAVIEGSLDNTTYTTISAIDANAADGWNIIKLDTAVEYRYYRFRGNSSTAKCNIAELKYFGVIISDSSVTNLENPSCTAVVTVGTQTQETTTAVQYKQSLTANVTSVSPNMGTSAGGTTIVIEGDNFDASDISKISVDIDGVACTVTAATSDSITCTTGAAPAISQRVSSLESVLTVSFATRGKAVINGLQFFYIDRWSETSTWGGITPPREGESVSIPAGQTILLDISPPKLKAIIVEGALIFDDANINLEADYIIIRNGRMQIGTWDEPIQNKITITIHGTRDDAALPTFGNKVIALMEGVLDIHGKKRSHTWTELDSTAAVGATSIIVQGNVDWAVGEQIVIASTDHDHFQSETRYISAVSAGSGKTTLSFVDPLVYEHYAGLQVIDGVDFEMRAEVGLLTRNVVIQGDDQSEALQYGVHIMAHSHTGDDSSIARISHTEVRQAGQAFNLGRYPIHFHLIGNVRESYVYGNAVHHTYNRAITIHGVHFLKVQFNVAYWTKGHTIFIEDGIETHNVIEDNLVISTRRSTALLDTDQTPASFWITNPNNIWRRNHAAGSDRYGFWFDLRPHPTGPSATNSICPTGVQLGEFTDNVAHSNVRYGLRIFHELSPRTYPCLPYEPFEENPPIPAVFTNFFGWKNMRNAVIGETIGAVTFKNIKAANNLRVGIEISNGDVSPAGSQVVQDSWIVGVTPENAGDSAAYQTNEVKGLVTPRKDNLYVKNVRFYNFNGAMSAIGTCSHCEHPAATDAGARTSYFQGLSFQNVTQRVDFNIPYKEILIDQDGSLTGKAGGVVTYYYDHLNVDGCTENQEIYDGLVCDNTVTVRRVEFSKLKPSDSFAIQKLLILNEKGNSASSFSEIPYQKVNESWAVPFVTGYSYNLSWASQADFTSMIVSPGKLIEETDAAITLVFNHSDYRETFDVTGVTNDTAITNSSALLSSIADSNKICGDWYHDVDSRLLYINVNGRDEQDLEIASVTCRVNCPTVEQAEKEDVIRVWSNATQWPNEVLPKDGDDVEIPAEWVLVLDVDTASLGTLTIKGDLHFDSTKESLTLTAARIWVAGQLFIGNSTEERYLNKATITLTGNRNSPSLIMGTLLDPSNKVLGVTGNVTMYGAEVNNVYVRLQAPAKVGDTVITLPVDVDWKVGDEIFLAPSQLSPTEFERFKITAISGGAVTLDGAIKYYHFGAATTTKTTDYGVLDMRTEVGLLTRNIIVQGSDENAAWGGRIYVAEIYDKEFDYSYRGRLEIDGIEMINLSQPNTTWAGLTFDSLTSSDNGDSIVSRSVMRDSLGWQVRSVGSTGVTLEQNIFFLSWQYQVKFEGVNTNIAFTNNLVVGNRERGLKATAGDNSYDLASAFYSNGLFTNSQVSNNIIAGCQQQCIISKGEDCSSSAAYTFSNNVIHSGSTGWLVDAPNTVCNAISKLTAYKFDVAVTSVFASKTLKASQLIITDSAIGVTLNIGGITTSATTISLTDSYFAGLSLVSTPEAYSNKEECSNLAGVMIPVSIESAQTIPPMPSHLPWHSSHSYAIFQSTFTVSGITFENFDDSLVSGCTQNTLFASNPYASDASTTTSVTDVTLSNVGDSNIVFFSGPDDGWITVENCGSWYCTGIYNILIRDLDGTLTGSLSSIMPQHSGIFDSKTCTASAVQNAYFCSSPQWAQLMFDSQDWDAQTRMLSPINITNSNGYRNDLNNFQDHAWDGFYTSLKRLSRYPAVVQTGQDYHIRFTSTVPDVTRWQLQGGLSSESITVNYAYQTIQSVRVTDANGNIVKPTVIAPGSTGVSTLASLSTCGANTYETTAMTVTLRITGDPSCVLKASLANSISASVRYSMTVQEFYAQDGTTAFIDKIAAVLGINPASIRVVQVVSGSSIVNCFIDSSIQDSDAASIAKANAELKGYIATLQKADVSILGSEVLNASYSVSLISPLDNNKEEESKKTQTIIIVVASVVGFLAIAIGSYFFYTRYYRKKAVVRQDRFAGHKIENTMQKLNYQSMVINTDPLQKSNIGTDLVSPSPLVDVSHDLNSGSPSYRPTRSPFLSSNRGSALDNNSPLVSRSIHSDMPLSKFGARHSRMVVHPEKREEELVFSITPEHVHSPDLDHVESPDPHHVPDLLSHPINIDHQAPSIVSHDDFSSPDTKKMI